MGYSYTKKSDNRVIIKWIIGLIVCIFIFCVVDVLSGDTVYEYGTIDSKEYTPEYWTYGKPPMHNPPHWYYYVTLAKRNNQTVVESADYSMWEKAKSGDRLQFETFLGGITKIPWYRTAISIDAK